MMRAGYFFLLTFLLGSCHAQNTAWKPGKFEKLILQEVETFRLQMKDGLPAAGIPSMDPLVIPKADLSPLDLGPLGRLKTAIVKDVVVEGLPDFVVDYMKYRIVKGTLEINMTFPLVQVKGHYNMDGTVMAIIPVYGEGRFESTTRDVKVKGHSLLMASGGVFAIEKLDLHAELGDFKLKAEGILGGGNLGQQINTMLENVGSKLAKQFAPMVANMLAEFARISMNDVLKTMDLAAILGG